MVECASKTLGSVVQPETVTKLRRYQIFDAIVDTNDEITMEIGTLVHAEAFLASDGSSITCTVATTKVTITQAALVDARVYGMATGSV